MQVVGDGHGFTQSGGVAFGTCNQLKAHGASILGGLGNTASGMYSAIGGGNGNTIKASEFSQSIVDTYAHPGLYCMSNFVTMDGFLTYVKNAAVIGTPTMLCRNNTNRLLTYTAFPTLSTILGGNVSLSSTTGIISGTIGPATVDTTYVGITVVESATGLAGYLGFYVSVLNGECMHDQRNIFCYDTI